MMGTVFQVIIKFVIEVDEYVVLTNESSRFVFLHKYISVQKFR